MNLQRMLWCTLIGIMVWIAMMSFEGAAFRKPCAETSWLKNIQCHSAPVADLELATDAACFRNLIAQQDPAANRRWNSEVIRVNTSMDFLFIILYWLTFVFLAKNRDAEIQNVNAPPRFPWWFTVVTGLISMAALLDVWENVRLLSALQNINGPLNDIIVPGAVSQAKWLFFAAAVLFLGLGFLRNRPFWTTVMALLMLLSAALTALGVWHTKLLPFAVASLSVALVIAVFRYFPLRPFGWKELFAGVEFAYLIRFQLVAALLLAVLLPAGYFLAPSIFIGLFDALGFWSFAFVTAAALYLAWSIMITIRLVFVYGPERFGGIELLPAASYLTWPSALAYAALAAPCLVMLFCGTSSLHWPYKMTAALIGVTTAVVVLWLMARLQYLLEPGNGDAARKMFPFQFLHAQKPDQPAPSASANPNTVSEKDGFHREGTEGKVHSGHKLAAAALIFSVFLYMLIGLAYKPVQPNPVVPATASQISADAPSSDSPAAMLRPHASKAHPPAAIFYLFFLLTIFVLLFSGVAFLLDKIRLPVFSAVLALSFLLGVTGTDHLFAVKSTTAPSPPSPADAFHAWENVRSKGQPDKPLVVVATAGGGIRAAAWTTQVLTGLAERCKGSGQPDRDNFSSSLILISSVSGGSLGNMYFAGSYESDGSLRQDLLPKIRYDAARTSLSSVGWGLLFPDFLRTVPLLGSALAPQDIDRGWALETQWLNNWNGHLWVNPPTLREWSADVRNGNRPVTIFNATASESGQRYILASTVFQEEDSGARQFATDFPANDVLVSTAARVSAAFPWVSPMPRAMTTTNPPGVHLADGGYYDNSGMLNATKWLLEAAGEIHKHPVLFIAIDASPPTSKEGKKWSWQHQAIGPIEALLAVRDSSQISRGKYERDLALHQLLAKGIAVKEFDMLYSPDPLGPLSWHLTHEQKAHVAEAWTDSTVVANREQIALALHCP